MTSAVKPRAHSNVIAFPTAAKAAPAQRKATTFVELTKAMVMEQHRLGKLDPAVLEYLLAGIGLYQ